MLRRPVKQEKQYSYTDIDVESNGDRDTSSPFGSCSSSTIAFKLTGLLKKQWQSFTDTNFAICQESTEFVVEHKPTFDKEKLKLIQLSTWIEQDITCGTVTAIKTRSQYDGPLLNDQTFSPDWNQDARKINELMEELNRQIVRENLLSGSGSRLSLTAFTSCFSRQAVPGSQGGNRDRDSDMRPMPIEVSRETVSAFVRDPRLFLQSPLHLALLCVLGFALVGLLVMCSLLLQSFSFALFLVMVAALLLYQLYARRDAVQQRLAEAMPAWEEASRLASELSGKLSETVKESFQSAAAVSQGSGSGSGGGGEVELEAAMGAGPPSTTSSAP